MPYTYEYFVDFVQFATDIYGSWNTVMNWDLLFWPSLSLIHCIIMELLMRIVQRNKAML